MTHFILKSMLAALTALLIIANVSHELKTPITSIKG